MSDMAMRMAQTLLWCGLTVALVSVGGCVSRAAKQPADERVTVGAIRWDAWFADAVNPYEKNLADKRWHGRLPFYAKIISDTEVEVRGDTQEAVDKEIAYAKKGGIDYWAFLYYSPTTRSDGFIEAYLRSTKKK